MWGVVVSIKGTHIDITEDSVVIRMSVRWINILKPLRELYITSAIITPIHHETHVFSHSLGVVYTTVIVQVENEGTIGQDG